MSITIKNLIKLKGIKMNRVELIRTVHTDDNNDISKVVHDASVRLDHVAEFTRLIANKARYNGNDTFNYVQIILDLSNVFTSKRFTVVDGPVYEILIGNDRYVDTVDNFKFDFEIPQMVGYEGTNMPDIYRKRMISKFATDLRSVMDEYDSVILFDLSLIEIANPDLKTSVRLVARMKIYNDDTYEPVSQKVEQLQQSTDSEVEVEKWIICGRIGKFKMFVLKLMGILPLKIVKP
jgi:hypothetical protein